jgi:hypothetical protein
MGKVAADITATSTTNLQAITGLSFPVNPDEVWEFDAYCQCQILFGGKSTSGGLKFGVGGPVSMTVGGHAIGMGPGSLVQIGGPLDGLAYSYITALSTPTGTFLGNSSGTNPSTLNGYVHVHCEVANGANSGTVQLLVEATGLSGVTSIVQANSQILARKQLP